MSTHSALPGKLSKPVGEIPSTSLRMPEDDRARGSAIRWSNPFAMSEHATANCMGLLRCTLSPWC